MRCGVSTTVRVGVADDAFALALALEAFDEFVFVGAVPHAVRKIEIAVKKNIVLIKLLQRHRHPRYRSGFRLDVCSLVSKYVSKILNYPLLDLR